MGENILRELSKMLRTRIILPKYRYSSAYTQRSDIISSDPEAKTLSPNQVISLKKFRQRPFPRTYPTLIVRDDGSSYRIWSSELPHKIIQFPMDDSALTEIEKERIMNKRTGKTKSRLLKIDISVDDEDEPEGEMLDMSSIIESEILEKSENVVNNEDSK